MATTKILVTLSETNDFDIDEYIDAIETVCQKLARRPMRGPEECEVEVRDVTGEV